ncbi:MAG: hypothetical protein KME45_19005 [Stenomitos rutilans HA7619-LM2]|jgi:nucleoside phosphorylase/tetratricopeptide (TPR) repeat protein|nr:hypothetical protein [Stenomitos rutilans HA7619-LM2]
MSRAVILTALPVEYLAVRAHLTDLQEEMHLQGTIYERGKFVANDQVWEVGIAEVGAGNAGTAVEAERAIAYFSPDILFFVGIAGGIKDVAIGDVVAATKVYGYESGKAENQFFTRPALGQSAYALVQRARSEARKGEWLQRLMGDFVSPPRVFIGPIAAGEKVIVSKESDVFNFIRASYNDAIAVEMEGFGFLRVAFAYPNINMIVIRGVSDLVEGKNDDSIEPERIRQEKASHHASAFAFEMLSKLKISGESVPLPAQQVTDTIQNNNELQKYPVLVEDGTIYIKSQPDNHQENEVVTPSFDIQYTIEELSKENYHNLPIPSYKQLVGREEDLKELLYRISPDFYERTVTVAGIGGVGKTSLALEAAYACLAAKKEFNSTSIPTFDMIVFSSAQLSTLSPQGIIGLNDSPRPMRTLQDLCIDIANTLKRSDLKLIDPNHQISALKDFLSSRNYKILVILDNFEALKNEDIHEIYEFLKKIKGNHVKTIVTTRNSERYDLNLKELSNSASLQMIDNLLTEKGLIADDNFRHKLSQMCGGIPLAIHYSIGILGLEKNPQKVLEKLDDSKSNLSQYCFDKLVSEIEKQNPIAYKLLVVLSVSPYGLTRENLFCITNVSDAQQYEANEALNMLSRCSLVFCDGGYHKMLQLTRKYSLYRLESDSNLELEVRESWVNCYLEIARTNGGEDQGEWHVKYDVINNEWKNFKEVFCWCENHQRYEAARSLWRFLSRFAYLYGYWSDRLQWSNWLMNVAFLRGDHGFLAEVKSACAWLTLLREGSENLRRAEDLLKGAWSLKQHCEPYISSVIAINLAVLYTRKREFEEADAWFKQYMELRKQTRGQVAELNERRLEIRYLLYWGERYYREEDYFKARHLYQQVTKKSEGIQWLRFKVKAYERLAFINIKEHKLEDAEGLLDAWYPVTQRNRDYRRMAFFERDYAMLEFEKENYGKAKEWAKKALERFQDLGMNIRVGIANRFVEECDFYLSRLINNAENS